MRLAVVWYSRTGTTQRVARQAVDHSVRVGHQVTGTALAPRVDLPYPLWLALSFVPGSRFPLGAPPPDLTEADACLLALPKWTFSCPPVNAFLARCARHLPPTALLVTCGGWDQERYLRGLEDRLRAGGVVVLGGLALKRREIEAGRAAEPLERFLERVFPGV